MEHVQKKLNARTIAVVAAEAAKLYCSPERSEENAEEPRSLESVGAGVGLSGTQPQGVWADVCTRRQIPFSSNVPFLPMSKSLSQV
mmetsp:Transcript_9569/g.28572  ORF Transcript_9569/g.28572 Transcript_9569/m.28572 type:complete len:86 (-) Transcript_9569:1890-2147(-)